MRDDVSLVDYYTNHSVESCMIPKIPHEKDSFIKRIYRENPLLGDSILPKSTYNTCYSLAKTLIDNVMKQMYEGVWRAPLKLDQCEIVTLVVVNLAKCWDRNKEPGFRKYIALAFGYDDESKRDRVWDIVKESLETALNRNNKLFIIKNGKREFYETVLVHSLGPMKSWYSQFDLLYNFYKENLLYSFIQEDPIFSSLVRALNNVIDYNSGEDEELMIASRLYMLRVGVRRLIQYCPNYSAVFLKDIVKRIHGLIRGDVPPSNRYIDSLIDDWYANKIRISISKPESQIEKKKDNSIKKIDKFTNDIIFDYRLINLRYYLSAGDLYLIVPTIRVKDNGRLSAFLKVSVCGTELTENLELFGNELGRSIKHKVIRLDKSFLSGEKISLWVQLFHGDELIYDSGDKMNRQVLFFSDGEEIRSDHLKKGNYTIIYPSNVYIDGINIDVCDNGSNISNIVLHEGYEIRSNGHVVALDSLSIKDIRIIEPECVPRALFEYQGNKYQLVKKENTIKFYSPADYILDRFVVIINGQRAELNSYWDELAGNRSVIPLCCENDDMIEITIEDVSENRIVFHKLYLLIDFEYKFNRRYYCNLDIDCNIQLSVNINGTSINYCFDVFDQKVGIEYDCGEIVIETPFVSCCFVGVDVKSSGYIWCDEINEQSVLEIRKNADINCEIIIGDDDYINPSNISLYKYNTDNDKEKRKKIRMRCENTNYDLGEILYAPVLIRTPIIECLDSVLTCIWMPFYVGIMHDLVLRINSQPVCSFDLVKNGSSSSEFIADNMTEGVYEYDIIDEFDKTVLAHDKLFVGDERYSRFYNHTLCLKYITEDAETSVGSIMIKPVYIENIQYVETREITYEGGIFDVYSGEMYYFNNAKEKVFFSRSYDDDHHKYMVNPVKIIYLNENYLRIVNQDDEGIYYFTYVENDNEYHQISDREPKPGSQAYRDVLFFLNEDNIPQEDAEVLENNKLSVLTEDGMNDYLVNEDEQMAKRVRIGSIKPEFSKWIEVEQNHVIEADVSERLIVNAGPGTGKTWSLIQRIIYLVNKLYVDPETIQILCFTRTAVEEIKKRMKAYISSGKADLKTNYVDIRTFDSFVTQFLYAVKNSNYRIMGRNYPIEKLNYDQRIEKMTEIIRKRPELISQCNHLIVDEVQDLVLERADLVLEMIKQIPRESGVTLLGDSCQAIYGYQVEGEGTKTEDFYRAIYEMGMFERCSYSQNYRQDTYWDGECRRYRAAIISSILYRCNESLKTICDRLPMYDTDKISDFNENTLKRLKEKGSVAILTRSNAQALEIATVFKKRNIDYVLRRKRNEGKLNRWIAYLFNSTQFQSFDQKDFIRELARITEQVYLSEEYADMWRNISSKHHYSTGRIGCRDMIIAIRNQAQNKRFFVDESKCDIIISTVHRSKGREYDNVIIDSNLVVSEKDELEEHRVTYVALSRSKSNVYTVNIPSVRFKTLENHRCFSWKPRGNNRVLDRFEVGFDNDIDDRSFCDSKGGQKYIREKNNSLIGKKVYLQKNSLFNVNRKYDLILEESNTVIGTTGETFFNDLEKALKYVKKLRSTNEVYTDLFPYRLVDIYISTIATAIGMATGTESDVCEYGDVICWNTLVIDGYARAEYF